MALYQFVFARELGVRSLILTVNRHLILI